MDVAMGTRVLVEIEELSLEEVLDQCRSVADLQDGSEAVRPGNVKKTHLEELDAIAQRHFDATKMPAISMTGRYLPLLYKIVSLLVSPPYQMSLLVVDFDSRFDPTLLTCSRPDLHHVYIYRPPYSTPEALRKLVAEADRFMLYDLATRQSAHREWWGTIVLGGLGAGDIMAGWKGWLRVEKQDVRPFPLEISVEEALQRREARQAAVDAAGWQVSSPWGGFIFHDD